MCVAHSTLTLFLGERRCLWSDKFRLERWYHITLLQYHCIRRADYYIIDESWTYTGVARYVGSKQNDSVIKE